jgi:hypothetical protein
MATRRSKPQPTWGDVKAKLADFDRSGLLGLIHDLYSSYKDNQTFLHTRFGLGEDVLDPYKKAIDRWIAPDVYRNQNISISKGKQAIADYKKAVGDPQGLAELMVFYCEQAANFCADFGNDDEAYFSALVFMFEQALKLQTALSSELQKALLEKLERVRKVSHRFGYGVGDDMDSLISEYTEQDEPDES